MKALQDGANPNFIKRDIEGSPVSLHECVKLEDESISVACTQSLLEGGADSSFRLVSNKNTPLHEAAAVGAEKVCKLLVDSMPNEAADTSNAYGNSPLHSAVRFGSVDIVRLLLQNGANVDAANHVGSTPLHLCAFLAQEDEESGISCPNASNRSDFESRPSTKNETRSGKTHEVNLKGRGSRLMVDNYLQIAAILISSKRVLDINKQDVNGYTPLHIAAERGCIEMVKLLVDSGCRLTIKTIIDHKGRGGRTVAGMAKFAGRIKTLKVIEDLEKISLLEGDDKIVTCSIASDLEGGYPVHNPIVGSRAVLRRVPSAKCGIRSDES